MANGIPARPLALDHDGIPARPPAPELDGIPARPHPPELNDDVAPNLLSTDRARPPNADEEDSPRLHGRKPQTRSPAPYSLHLVLLPALSHLRIPTSPRVPLSDPSDLGYHGSGHSSRAPGSASSARLDSGGSSLTPPQPPAALGRVRLPLGPKQPSAPSRHQLPILGHFRTAPGLLAPRHRPSLTPEASPTTPRPPSKLPRRVRLPLGPQQPSAPSPGSVPATVPVLCFVPVSPGLQSPWRLKSDSPSAPCSPRPSLTPPRPPAALGSISAPTPYSRPLSDSSQASEEQSRHKVPELNGLHPRTTLGSVPGSTKAPELPGLASSSSEHSSPAPRRPRNRVDISKVPELNGLHPRTTLGSVPGSTKAPELPSLASSSSGHSSHVPGHARLRPELPSATDDPRFVPAT